MLKRVLKFLGIFIGILTMLVIFSLLTLSWIHMTEYIIVYLITNVTENSNIIVLLLAAPWLIVVSAMLSIIAYRIKFKEVNNGK